MTMSIHEGREVTDRGLTRIECGDCRYRTARYNRPEFAWRIYDRHVARFAHRRGRL